MSGQEELLPRVYHGGEPRWYFRQPRQWSSPPVLRRSWRGHPPPCPAHAWASDRVTWCQATSMGYSGLTVARIDGHRCRAAGHASGEEGHIERSLDIGVLLAQLVQVCEQWEVNDGEGDVPAVGREGGEERRTWRSKVREGHQQTEQFPGKGCRHRVLAAATSTTPTSPLCGRSPDSHRQHRGQGAPRRQVTPQSPRTLPLPHQIPSTPTEDPSTFKGQLFCPLVLATRGPCPTPSHWALLSVKAQSERAPVLASDTLQGPEPSSRFGSLGQLFCFAGSQGLSVLRFKIWTMGRQQPATESSRIKPPRAKKEQPPSLPRPSPLQHAKPVHGNNPNQHSPPKASAPFAGSYPGWPVLQVPDWEHGHPVLHLTPSYLSSVAPRPL